MTTKTAVRAAYLQNLKDAYPFYTPGSRPLALAEEAVDAALAGRFRLEGTSFEKALADCGLPKKYTLRGLRELPE